MGEARRRSLWGRVLKALEATTWLSWAAGWVQIWPARFLSRALRPCFGFHIIAASLLVGTNATAQGGQEGRWADWDAYVRAHRYTCPGPFETLDTPRRVTLAGKSYLQSGYRLKIEAEQADADHTVRIGVVSAIKDTSPGTMSNLDDALAWFEKRGVEWVVANGDLALQEFDMEVVQERLGRSGLPILLLPGNSDSNSSLVRVYKARMKKYENLVNGTWVRQIVGDDVEFWTLPGYHNRRYIRQGAGCKYDAADVRKMRRALRPAGGRPVVLVSHGPPAGRGPRALDWISQKKNVGDAEINKLIDRENISFGLFGHILEAGGWGNKANFSTRVRPGIRSSTLYVNAGALSGDPWELNDGRISYGMAMIFTIENASSDSPRAYYETRLFDYAPPG